MVKAINILREEWGGGEGWRDIKRRGSVHLKAKIIHLDKREKLDKERDPTRLMKPQAVRNW